MQYKSARPCFNIFSKKLLVCAAAFVGLSVGLRQAEATITITAVYKKDSATQIQNLSAGIYFYPVYDQAQNTGLSPKPSPLPTSGVLDPLFNYLDLGQDPSPSSDPSTQDGLIYFQVHSDKTSFSNTAYLVATMSQNTNGGAAVNELVPIVGTNNGGGAVVGCSGNCLQGNGPPANQSPTGNPFYYLVNYSAGQTVTVAISPTVFCESMQAVAPATENNLCLTSPFFNGNITPITSTSQAMTFNFAIYLSTDILSPVTTVPTNAAQDTLPVSLEFENLNPVPATPSPTPTEICNLTQDGVYTPVEGGFQLSSNPGQFFQVVNDPAGTVAGLNQLIAIAAPVPTPLATTPTTYLTNMAAVNANGVRGLVTPFLLSLTAPIVGFAPDDAARDNAYTLGFMAEDAAGYIFDDGGVGKAAGGCTFPDSFDTSVVQGFLSQSKCFIATAAFRDLNSAPLVLLRAFRDQFLEHFSLGRGFVHWYYAWSPDAAEWLIEHPVFRFPVLLALIPLQTFAWLILHPFVMLTLMGMGLSLVLWGSLLRRSTE